MTKMLIAGDWTEGDDVCITIHWHEGVPVVAENAKFGSFRSAQAAIEAIANADPDFNANGCYTKVKYSIRWRNGGAWRNGRLDLSIDDHNPFSLKKCDNIFQLSITDSLKKYDNIFQLSITEFLEWQIDNGDKTRLSRMEVEDFLATHPLTDSDLIVRTALDEVSIVRDAEETEILTKELARHLVNLPKSRQQKILREIEASGDPTVYMLHLLAALRSIEAAGF